MTAAIPFYSFTYQNEQVKAEMQQALLDVFDSAWYVLGERVAKFEKEYAAYLGVKHCIGVGNGLDALKISLRALGIGQGDEVIVPANTYIATLLAVSETGALPVLVDPNPDTFNIDPSKITAKITAKTKAIIPVHLYGLPCEMDAITDIANRYGLFLVEDNAQATGSVYKGQKTGSLGHLNAHSFYPTKNLGCLGDGGAITTNDDDLAHQVRMLRNYGSEQKYKNERLGYNSRLDEIQAAALSVKLPFIDRWRAEKALLADVYHSKLSDVRHLQLPAEVHHSLLHSHHLFVIKSNYRDALSAYLKEQGVDTLIHYPIPAYSQQAYRNAGFAPEEYPVTERLTAEVLSLPLYPGMKLEQVEQVCSLIRKFTF
ncbi:MAG: DegT/DnrJ/EryC1/StrS family aminotransferase [Cytophagaceae bacterium]|jgi:dTDP-4-amino-4,6-dideoxygalactose transaminase|nr:DegT/DnrJ/EryC1/StrS family aminotransferase [Cytophagaceae bacterium]